MLIEVRQEYSQEIEQSIMNAVHTAIRESFKIKSDDRNIRLIVHKPHRFLCPPVWEKPELFTHVSIDCYAGRSVEEKNLLYKTIIGNLEQFGIPQNHVKILLREIAGENWVLGG